MQNPNQRTGKPRGSTRWPPAVEQIQRWPTHEVSSHSVLALSGLEDRSFFTLAAFQIFYFSWFVSSLILRYPDMLFFTFVLLGIHIESCIYGLISFISFGKFSNIFFSNIYLLIFYLFFSYTTAIIHMFGVFTVSHALSQTFHFLYLFMLNVDFSTGLDFSVC